MNVPLATVGTATVGTGIWLFSYNRENFQYDAGQRFGRFMTSRNMANAQMGQYREDTHGLTEMTSSKMDTWQIVNTLFLCVCAALSCAGRIGMHGCAPPGWMCALYSGNIFVSIMFNGISLWMDMHGSLRAQCAMVSILTRKARLPIPSLAQLDQARMFGSSYEKQTAGDIFRVPFMKHPEDAPELPDVDDGANGKAKDGKKAMNAHHVGDPNKEFASTERETVPTWIRDEQLVDKAGGSTGCFSEAEPTDSPQHFQLLAQAQAEWYGYDCYARVTMLYGVIHYLYAISYYSIGTTLSELRGYWISWAITLLFMTAQALVMRMDILQVDGNSLLPKAEWLGHAAPFFAILGGTMEFRFWWSSATVIVGWIFVILCFFCHMMMAVRQLDLAWPTVRDVDMPEEPTKQWWPKEWAIPSSFTKALWILAPPKKLEAGQQDLMNEMDSMKRAGGGVSCKRRRGNSNSSVGNKRQVTIEDLHQECARVDQLFGWWFNDGVWSQISREAQTDLHDIYKKYKNVRQQVDDIEAGSGAASEGGKLGKGGGHGDLSSMDEQLEKVKKRLDDAEDRHKPSGNIEGGSPTVSVQATMRTPFSEHSALSMPDLPWQITRAAVIANIVCWLYMMIVSGVECALGPRALLKPPGEPPWIRDVKLRHWTPGYRIHLSTERTPDDYQLFAASIARWHGDDADIPFPPPEEKEAHDAAAGTEHGGAASSHRRLADAYGKRTEAGFQDLAKLLPSIGWLVDTLEKENATKVQRTPGADGPTELAPAFMSPTLRVNKIVWPPLFEPRHLVCGSKSSVLLTTRGAGALVPRAGAEDLVTATPFSLDGTLGHGPLAGAALTSTGLQLLTKSGTMLACEGHGPKDGGVWPCKEAMGTPIPASSGSRLASAALTESHDGLSLTVAVVFEDLPFTVSVFTKAHDDLEGWKPQRTVHIPPTVGELAGMVITNDELFVTSRTGYIHRQHLLRGTIAAHRAPAMPQSREFHASCPLHEDKMMHLALRQPGSGLAWVPELLTSA